jgi:hypothetical protein
LTEHFDLTLDVFQFNVGDWMSAYVKYQEYYIYLPKTGVVSLAYLDRAE